MKNIISLIGFLALVFVISGIGSLVTIPEVSGQYAPGPAKICEELKRTQITCSASDFRWRPANGWYQQLNKASWQPPAYVFGPVWTTLYIMIAVSGWLVWRRLPDNGKFTSLIMAPYWLQLLLNFLWSILFFGMHRAGLSLVDIALMLVVIGVNIGTFMKVSRVAAYLLVPYFLWVAYATSLNAAILALN